MQRVLTMILALGCVGGASAMTDVYRVNPLRAGWSAKADPEEGISQVITLNVDTLKRVEVFIGFSAGAGTYSVNILSFPNGTEPLARASGLPPEGNHVWLPFDLTIDHPDSFMKGRRYRVEVTRSGSDSLQYYWQEGQAVYPWGFMIVDGDSSIPIRQLCMRAYGVMSPVCSTYWAFNIGPTPRNEHMTDVAQKAGEAGVRMARQATAWSSVERSPGNFDFSPLRRIYYFRRDTLGCEMFAMATIPVPGWASTHMTIDTSGQLPETTYSEHAPPINLWPDVGETNYVARHLEVAVDSIFSDDIRVWGVWNEPNHLSRFWKVPNVRQYQHLTMPRQRCSLYVRLCWVTDSVIKHQSALGRENDIVLVGSMSQVDQKFATETDTLIMGKTWLRWMYEIAESEYGGPFWDGVAIHPYQTTTYFDAGKFQADAETLRAIMREYGHDDGLLWITELGWKTTTEERQERTANNLCKAFASSKASEVLVDGRYDRMCWYSFMDYGDTMGLLDSAPGYERKMPLYASGQTRDLLVGKRFTQRLLLGRPEKDDSVRIYEFEDPGNNGKRMWVGWKTGTSGEVEVSIPARSDTVDTAGLAYDANQPIHHRKVCETDGWLTQTLTPRPVFITETGEIARPNLVVDSIRLVPAQPQVGRPLTVTYWVRNHGSGEIPQAWAAGFYWNDSLLNPAYSWPVWPDTGLDQGQSVAYFWTLESIPQSMQGSGLFRATANPEQEFVELGMDDNSGWRRTIVRYPPYGEIAPPLTGRGNLPVIPVHLSSTSWEKDSTGSLPADSARLKQVLMSGDTLALDSVLSPWFAFTPDTVWRYLLGCGRYRLAAQFKDGEWNESEWYEGAEAAVFDTVPPVGSISIADGARFITSNTCTVALNAYDELSGVFRMRLGTEAPVELSWDPAVPVNDGWEIFGGAYEEAFDMVRLDLGGAEPAAARRPVPNNAALAAFCGDTVALSADLLVSVPEDEGMATGRVALVYLYEGPSDDTSRQTVAGFEFEGGRSALCGSARPDTAFLLPVPDNGWLGAEVLVETYGSAWISSGTVRFANVRLEPTSPWPERSDWSYPDSLAEWELAEGSGLRFLHAAFKDSAGAVSLPVLDSVIVDAVPPEVGFESPADYSLVNGQVNFLGWAYDPEILPGHQFFEWRRLQCRHIDSTEWLGVDPDSVSCSPVLPGGIWHQPGELGDWNTMSVEDGWYELRLTAQDSAGNQTSTGLYLQVDNSGSDGDDGLGDGPGGGGMSIGSGSVWVGSQTGVLAYYDDELNLLDTITLGDSADPIAIAALVRLSDDSLLVADGREQAVLKSGRSRGSGPRPVARGFRRIAGMARDEAGRFWVLDSDAGELYRYSPAGVRELTLGGPGADSLERLSGPEGLAVDAGLVYVADTRNRRLAVWDTAGVWQAGIVCRSGPPGALAVMSPGRIYVLNRDRGGIEGINNAGGRFLTLADSAGRAWQELLASADADHLYTLRPQDNKVLRLPVRNERPGGGGGQSGGQGRLPERYILYQPWPNPARGKMQVRYGLPRTAPVSLKVFDIAGRECRKLVDAEQQRPGYYSLVWDGRDDRGRELAQGIYFLRLKTPEFEAVRKTVLTR